MNSVPRKQWDVIADPYHKLTYTLKNKLPPLIDNSLRELCYENENYCKRYFVLENLDIHFAVLTSFKSSITV